MEKVNYLGNSFLIKGSNEVGILLLHGWASPPDEFLPLAKYLNSLGYAISAPLLRGHGTKPEDLLGVLWQDWLSDARDALEKMKKSYSKIFVGGISMGGDLAILLSQDENVAGIISLGAPVKFHFQNLAKISLLFMGMFKTYRKKYYPPWVRKRMGKRKVYLSYPVESAEEMIRLARAVEKFLPQVGKPILIMQSTTDHLVSKRSPEIIFDKVKSKIKEISWVEDGYHVFVDEKKVHEKIGKFILRIGSKVRS